MTLFATDPALAWLANKTTTTRAPIKVDSNFTCEYDAEGYFPGIWIWNYVFYSKHTIKIILDPKYCHIYHYCAIGAHEVMQCFDNLWFSFKKHISAFAWINGLCHGKNH